MSIVAKLKPHVEDLKVHKRISDMTNTERRLNFMTAIIMNKSLTNAEKDSRLKKIVAESQIEKKLREMGIKI